MDLLDLLLHLDVYTLTQREGDYSNLLTCLIRILQYDRVGIQFMSALYLTEKNSHEKKQQSKSASISNLTSGVCSGITSFIKLISTPIITQVSFFIMLVLCVINSGHTTAEEEGEQKERRGQWEYV